MNTGVEILLKRMQDNPEDFSYNSNHGMSRWMRLLDHALGEELLTDEENQALKEGLKEAKRTRFTELVMRELAGEDGLSDEGKLPLNQGIGISPSGLRVSPLQNNTNAIDSYSYLQAQQVKQIYDEQVQAENRKNLLQKMLGK